MGRYAKDTAVSADRSIAQIKATVKRYGATGWVFGEEGDEVVIGFRLGDRIVRRSLKLPDPGDKEFRFTPTGLERKESVAREAWEKGCRQRYRALFLSIKARLEEVESGIVTFDQAWLPWLVLPDKSTVGDKAIPAVEAAYLSGKAPQKLLPDYGGTSA